MIKTDSRCVTNSMESEKAVSSLELMTNSVLRVDEASEHSKLVEEDELFESSNAFEGFP